MHQLACMPSAGSPSLSKAPRQSLLYGLAAKEKLSGDLGSAAEASLRSIFQKSGTPWPGLVSLHFEESEGDVAVLEEFEGRRLAVVQLEWAQTLAHGVDLVHLHSCEIPMRAIELLAPGGLVLVEGLTCTAEHDFSQFMKKAERVGAVAVGRRIAVIVKHGTYSLQPDRLKDAVHLAMQYRGTAHEQEGEEEDDSDGNEDDDL